MVAEIFEFTGHKAANLPAVMWRPEGEIRAVLQVTHGMTEHMGRYERFACDLCSQGVAVAGFDLRGHGKNAGDPNIASCDEGGWAASIEDMHLFFELLNQRFPELPHYMLGFSLGSFLLREYLGKYPDGIAGAIIAGTGHQPEWLLSVMMGIIKAQIKKVGYDRTTDLVRRLSFGTYNQKCKPNRTTADWLCSDEAELDRYLADPLVRKDISAGLFYELLGSMKRTAGPSAYAGWNKETSIFLLNGDRDPVGNCGKGVQRVYRQMKKAGIADVLWKEIPFSNHDLFHEEKSGAAETVRRCICDWLQEAK